MTPALSADVLAAKLAEWFPWARWECASAGGYCCVWAGDHGQSGELFGYTVRWRSQERVARCRTWENARDAAKRWAWKQGRR